MWSLCAGKNPPPPPSTYMFLLGSRHCVVFGDAFVHVFDMIKIKYTPEEALFRHETIRVWFFIMVWFAGLSYVHAHEY